jgi:hypothetical protein
MSDLTHDLGRTCPECEETSLHFRELPASMLCYEERGENYTLHFGPSRDYSCPNCGCAFILLMEEAP